MKNDCWRLAQYCVSWAAENQHSHVRMAFLAMASGWAQLAVQEPGIRKQASGLAIDEQTAIMLNLAGCQRMAGLDYRLIAPPIGLRVDASLPEPK